MFLNENTIQKLDIYVKPPSPIKEALTKEAGIVKIFSPRSIISTCRENIQIPGPHLTLPESTDYSALKEMLKVGY